jgi:hypothetical protein
MGAHMLWQPFQGEAGPYQNRYGSRFRQPSYKLGGGQGSASRYDAAVNGARLSFYDSGPVFSSSAGACDAD